MRGYVVGFQVCKFTIDSRTRPAEGSTCTYWKELPKTDSQTGLFHKFPFPVVYILFVAKNTQIYSFITVALSRLLPFNGGAGSFLL